jgi:nickel-dependent lactate racemase
MTEPLPTAVTIGGPHQSLTTDEVDRFLTERLRGFPVDGKSVALVVPDATRSCPLPLLLRIVHRELVGRATSLVAVIALGTHSYMEPDELDRWCGAGPDGLAATYPGMTVVNHEWQDPAMIVDVGTLPAERIAELSGGRMAEDVHVEINRHVVEADVSIVIGPVFPHEVVGISGGNKYFIPGCATHDIIDLSHWVGALIGVEDIIGTTGITPVRAIINAGSELIPTLRLGICLVVKSGTEEIEAISAGGIDDAWAQAAEIAAASHVVYVDQPFRRVVAMMPTRYDDIWTAAKGCYKMQPAMADGGEVIIYAPHVTEVSEVHHEIYEIGYHCIEYFTKQWDRFAHVPKGVLAHSTHVRGAGSYDPVTGVETNRIRVTLCTRIPPEVCAQVNLGYLDPDELDLDALAADPDTFVQPNAGEVLYRIAGERPATPAGVAAVAVAEGPSDPLTEDEVRSE